MQYIDHLSLTMANQINPFSLSEISTITFLLHFWTAHLYPNPDGAASIFSPNSYVPAYFEPMSDCQLHRASLESAGPQNSCDHLNDK